MGNNSTMKLLLKSKRTLFGKTDVYFPEIPSLLPRHSIY